MSSARRTLSPVALRKEGDAKLVIEWNDGHRSSYTWNTLRARCPCATCREERDKPRDPFRVLSTKDLTPRPPLAPVSLTPVGHYAYKITWNDGHDTGIYTLDSLREELCECAQCTARGKAH